MENNKPSGTLTGFASIIILGLVFTAAVVIRLVNFAPDVSKVWDNIKRMNDREYWENSNSNANQTNGNFNANTYRDGNITRPNINTNYNSTGSMSNSTMDSRMSNGNMSMSNSPMNSRPDNSKMSNSNMSNEASRYNGRVIKENHFLRDAPSDKGNLISEINIDEEIYIDRDSQRGKWFYVTCRLGEGWMHGDDIEFLVKPTKTP